MPNKAYVKGRNFENSVKKLLERKGFFVVRSAGSKGLFDLIAIDRKNVIGVQCKLGGNLSRNKLDSILEIAKKYNIIPVLAYRMKGDRKQRIVFWDLQSSVITDDIYVLLDRGGK